MAAHKTVLILATWRQTIGLPHPANRLNAMQHTVLPGSSHMYLYLYLCICICIRIRITEADFDDDALRRWVRSRCHPYPPPPPSLCMTASRLNKFYSLQAFKKCISCPPLASSSPVSRSRRGRQFWACVGASKWQRWWTVLCKCIAYG